MAALPAAPLLVSHPAAGRTVAGRWDLPGAPGAGLSAMACAAIALGRSTLGGLPDTTEVRVFTAALRALGVGIDRVDDGTLAVQGRGVGGLAEPARVLTTGDSAAVAALLLGLVATHPVVATIDCCDGYAPLPPDLLGSLTRIGACLALRSGQRLPGTIVGTPSPFPAEHRVEGEWERAALLLAGLNIPGRTTVHDGGTPPRTLDRLLVRFGAVIGEGAGGTSVTGHADLTACHIRLPGDADLACLALLAALVRPGGSLILPRVAVDGLDPAFLPALRTLGADIRVTTCAGPDGLSGADLCLHPSSLTGTVVDLRTHPASGQALPLLLVAAAAAQGHTTLVGAGPLRGRLDGLVSPLVAAGIDIVWQGDDLLVARGIPAGTGPVSAGGDAALALALLAWGCGGQTPLAVADATTLLDRYPGLIAGFNALGGAVGLGERA